LEKKQSIYEDFIVSSAVRCISSESPYTSYSAILNSITAVSYWSLPTIPI